MQRGAGRGQRQARAGGRRVPAPAAAPVRRVGHPLEELQRQAGNRTVCREIRRFAVPDDYSFADQDRASLPLSIDLQPIQTGQERHHVISDKSILGFLEGAVEDRDGKRVVPVNPWVLAALRKEIERADPLLGAREGQDLSTEERRKVAQQRLQLIGYQDLLSDFEKADAQVDPEAEPDLPADVINDTLLPILEWMPPNLIIDKQARRFDPGDLLDIEAVLLQRSQVTRNQLVTLAIAMGGIDDTVIGKLNTAFEGTGNEEEWSALVVAGRRAKGNNPAIAQMLADLQSLTPGMFDRRGGKQMARSTTGQKQKLNKDAWAKKIVELFPKR